jgi:hypothetical protein
MAGMPDGQSGLRHEMQKHLAFVPSGAASAVQQSGPNRERRGLQQDGSDVGVGHLRIWLANRPVRGAELQDQQLPQHVRIAELLH